MSNQHEIEELIKESNKLERIFWDTFAIHVKSIAEYYPDLFAAFNNFSKARNLSNQKTLNYVEEIRREEEINRENHQRKRDKIEADYLRKIENLKLTQPKACPRPCSPCQK